MYNPVYTSSTDVHVLDSHVKDTFCRNGGTCNMPVYTYIIHLVSYMLNKTLSQYTISSAPLDKTCMLDHEISFRLLFDWISV